MITDKEINQVADDEKQKDWNELRYADIYKDAFVDGAKWARSKVSRVELPVRAQIADIKKEFEEKFHPLLTDDRLVYSNTSIRDLWIWFESKIESNLSA